MLIYYMLRCSKLVCHRYEKKKPTLFNNIQTLSTLIIQRFSFQYSAHSQEYFNFETQRGN